MPSRPCQLLRISLALGWATLATPVLAEARRAPALAETSRSPVVSSLEVDEDGQPILAVTLHSPRAARTLRFALDTGSAFCVLDSSVPAEFFCDDGEVCQGVDGTGRPFQSPLIRLLRVEVAGMVRDQIPAIRGNLKTSLLGRFQDRPMDGILGMSFLRGTRFVLDMAMRQLEWWRFPGQGGIILPVRYGSTRTPVINLRLAGREAEVRVDTGSASGLGLPWELRPPGTGQISLTASLTGLAETGEVMQVAQIEAGGEAWREVPVCFQRHGGEIGLEVWSAAPVGFDFIQDRLALVASPGIGLPIRRLPPLRLPLVWNRDGRQASLSVHHVKPGSPMADAGFQAGDSIQKVGPLAGASLSRAAIQERVAQGAPLEWLLQRQGKPLTLRFPAPATP